MWTIDDLKRQELSPSVFSSREDENMELAAIKRKPHGGDNVFILTDLCSKHYDRNQQHAADIHQQSSAGRMRRHILLVGSWKTMLDYNHKQPRTYNVQIYQSIQVE